jgi:hypothetical protein
MCSKVSKHFEVLRPTSLLLLLQLLSAAATAATQMQRPAAVAPLLPAAAAAVGHQGSSTSADAVGKTRLDRYNSGGSSGSSSSCLDAAAGCSSGGSTAAAALSVLGDISDGSVSDDDYPAGGSPVGSTVWGGRGTVNCTVNDEDVQSQAWLPQMLLGLLHWSSATARNVSDSPPPWTDERNDSDIV